MISQSIATKFLISFLQFCFTSSFVDPSCFVCRRSPSYSPASIDQKHNPNTSLQTASSESAWTSDIGFSVLETVQGLARAVSSAEEVPQSNTDDGLRDGTGKDSLTAKAYKVSSLYSEDEDISSMATNYSTSSVDKTAKERLVLSALAKLERDMTILDNIAGTRPSLSALELSLLSLSVGLTATAPAVFPYKITEFLAPACAAFAASLGIGAEFVGKVAVADGKEIAAKTLQCAAESEGFFAQAERTKAVLPLCVGIGATGATLSLLVPTLIGNFAQGNVQLETGLFLLAPLVSILAAAVSSLALLEIQNQTARAISVGNRRFAKAGSVGRTWLSTYEQVQQNSKNQSNKWKSFAWSVLPGPTLGCLVPGDIATKTVFVGAIAACQSAYYLALAENTLARGQDAVALKSRSAAVCDSYANQGARSSAILPFTSALSSLCAAATAAVVEIPFVEGLSHLGAMGIITQAGILALFPTLGSLFAAAASVSKARCEVDAEAATQAAATMALEYEMDPSVLDDTKNDPIVRPLRGVGELIICATRTGWKSVKKTKFLRFFLKPFVFSMYSIRTRLKLMRKR